MNSTEHFLMEKIKKIGLMKFELDDKIMAKLAALRPST